MGQPGSGPTPEQIAEAQAKRAAIAKVRPRGITILGVVVLLVGLGNLLLGLYYTSLVGIVVSANFWEGILTLLFGIFLMIAGAGLLTMRPWAWWVALIMVLINLGNSIYYSIYPLPGTSLTLRIVATVGLAIVFIYLIISRKGYMRGAQAVTTAKA